MRILFISVILVLFQVSQKKEIYVYSSEKSGEESIAYKATLSIKGDTYIYSNKSIDGREVNVNDVLILLENEKAVFNLDTMELFDIINSSEGNEHKYYLYENEYVLFKKGFGITKLIYGNENLEYRLQSN